MEDQVAVEQRRVCREGHSDNKEHDEDATYANVSRLRHDWTDVCLSSSIPLAPHRQ
jgi:hypothetical protein